MKNKTFLLIMLPILAAVIIISCKNTASNKINFAKVELKGCNNQFDKNENARDGGEYQNDTVIFNLVNDTLKVTVGINYTCCSSMSANNIVVENNTITITISDTTESSEQYCRCDCYYVFEYSFTNIGKETYKFNVFFNSPFDEKDVNLISNFNRN